MLTTSRTQKDTLCFYPYKETQRTGRTVKMTLLRNFKKRLKDWNSRNKDQNEKVVKISQIAAFSIDGPSTRCSSRIEMVNTINISIDCVFSSLHMEVMGRKLDGSLFNDRLGSY